MQPQGHREGGSPGPVLETLAKNHNAPKTQGHEQGGRTALWDESRDRREEETLPQPAWEGKSHPSRGPAGRPQEAEGGGGLAFDTDLPQREDSSETVSTACPCK